MKEELNLEEMKTVSGGDISQYDKDVEVGAIYREFNLVDDWNGYVKVINVNNGYVKFYSGRREFDTKIIKKVDSFTLQTITFRQLIDLSKKYTEYTWKD